MSIPFITSSALSGLALIKIFLGEMQNKGSQRDGSGME